jgi:hypothetical protein
MPKPHVHVILSEDQLPTSLHAALRRVAASASFSTLRRGPCNAPMAAADAVVVVSPRSPVEAAHRLGEFFAGMASRPRAMLVLAPDQPLAARPACPPDVPISFGTCRSAEEIGGYLSALVERRGRATRARGGRRRFERPPVARYVDQLREASRLQRQLLPASLPRMAGVSFSLVFEPFEFVSGDVYDVRRVDADHVSAVLADATGHGLSAALLASFVRRDLRAVEFHHGRTRLLAPDEVLARLNRELLASELADCHFLAVTYALLNLRTREVRLARGGAPYPVLRTPDGMRRLIKCRGPLVGVTAEATFPVETLRLGRGDALLLYTDGVDGVLHRADSASEPAGGNGELRCDRAARGDERDAPVYPPDEGIRGTGWYQELEHDVDEALEGLRLRHGMLRRMGRNLDDLTVLGIRIDN